MFYNLNMPLVSDHCICIRKTEFSETSQILTLFSRQFGLVRVMAKGAHRRTKAGASRFDGGIDLLDAGHAVFSNDPSRELSLLTDWKLEDGHLALRNNIRSLYLALYAAELLGLMLEEHDPHPEVFDLLDRALADLQTPNLEESFLAFQLDLLRESGFMPEFNICISCGNAIGDREDVFFSSSRGGVICEKCHAVIADHIPLDVRLLRLIRMIHAPAGDSPRRLPRLTRHQTDPINLLLLHHIEHSLGRRPKSAQYILPKKPSPGQKTQLTCNSTGQGA
jgi:DNA repair protein RecO (recombination protein O)